MDECEREEVVLTKFSVGYYRRPSRLFLTVSDIYSVYFFNVYSARYQQNHSNLGCRLDLTIYFMFLSGNDLGSEFSYSRIWGRRC